MSIFVGDLIHARDNSIDKNVVDPICPEWLTVKSIEVVDWRLEVALNDALVKYVLEGDGRTFWAMAYHQDKEFHRVSLVTH